MDNNIGNNVDNYYADDFGFSGATEHEAPMQEDTQATNTEAQGEEFTGEPIENINEQENVQPEPIVDEVDLFGIPQEFNDTTEALKWYAERFEVIKQASKDPNSPLYKILYDTHVTQELSKREQELQGFENAFKAFQKYPKEFMLQYMPEALAEYGISPVLKPEDIEANVEKVLQNEYGEDYKDKFNPADLINPRSMSSSILLRQQEVLQHYYNQNAKNQEIFNNWNKNLADGKSNIQQQQQMSNEQLIEAARQEHANKFKENGFTDEAFNQFLQEATNYKMEIEDLHHAMYFEGYMQRAYERGLNEGRQSVYTKVKQQGDGEQVKLPDSIAKLIASQNGNSNSRPMPQKNFLDQAFGGEMIIPSY